MNKYIRAIDSNGMTLVELMVVIAIMAILLFFTSSAFTTHGPLNKLGSISKEIYYDLYFAKFRAMEDQREVSICFDKNLRINGENRIFDYLIVKSWNCDNFVNPIKRKKITTKKISISTHPSKITFSPTGFLEGLNNTTLTIEAKGYGKSIARDIVINRLGRIVLGDVYEKNN